MILWKTVRGKKTLFMIYTGAIVDVSHVDCFRGKLDFVKTFSFKKKIIICAALKQNLHCSLIEIPSDH